jgi:hypothetical protein
LAVIAHEVEGPNPRVLTGEIADHVPTAVGTAIVDQDEFEVIGAGSKHRL